MHSQSVPWLWHIVVDLEELSWGWSSATTSLWTMRVHWLTTSQWNRRGRLTSYIDKLQAALPDLPTDADLFHQPVPGGFGKQVVGKHTPAAVIREIMLKLGLSKSEVYTRYCFHVSLCLSVPAPVCPCACLSLCLSVPVPVCPCACLSLCLSVPVPVCPCACLSLCLSVPVPVCPCACLSLCLSVPVSVCASVRLLLEHHLINWMHHPKMDSFFFPFDENSLKWRLARNVSCRKRLKNGLSL